MNEPIPARGVVSWPQPHEPAELIYVCPTCDRTLGGMRVEPFDSEAPRYVVLAEWAVPRLTRHPVVDLPWYGRPNRRRGRLRPLRPRLPLVVRCDCGADILCSKIDVDEALRLK